MSATLLPTAALLLSFAFFFYTEAAGRGSFSVDLIHRDSPRSPFYNSSSNLFDRVSRAVSRSNSRINYFRSVVVSSASPTDVESKLIPNEAEYLMTLSIGTPALEFLAIADTGSDLIWIQCQPCDNCYKQVTPLFDPTNSSTYRDLPCTSNLCAALPQSSCGSDSNCLYSYSYGDQSYTNGNLASETFTLGSTSGSTVKIPKVTFGCGHNNDGTFDSHGSGLVGLGGGPLSLVSQLGSSIDGKFSYCLVPFDKNQSSSRLDFGDSAVVSGMSTPLVAKSPATFFYVTLQKISVGEKSVDLSELGEGNIILDSGTTLTYLPQSAFEDLVSAIKVAIDLNPVKDPTGNFELCYEADALSGKAPDMTFGFDGADLVLTPSKMFIEVDNNVVCLAMIPSDSLSIFGNIAQQNIKVGYDLVGKKVSFKPTDCSKD